MDPLPDDTLETSLCVGRRRSLLELVIDGRPVEGDGADADLVVGAHIGIEGVGRGERIGLRTIGQDRSLERRGIPSDLATDLIEPFRETSGLRHSPAQRTTAVLIGRLWSEPVGLAAETVPRVRVPGRGTHADPSVSRDDEWGTRPRSRLWYFPHACGIRGAGVFHRVTTQESAQDRSLLVEPVQNFVRLPRCDAECFVLFGLAGADTDRDATASGDLVQAQDLGGKKRWMPKANGCDKRANLDRTSLPRKHSQQRPRLEVGIARREKVVGDPRVIETEGLEALPPFGQSFVGPDREVQHAKEHETPTGARTIPIAEVRGQG
jgi:hypothetical protein